jgi:DNA-binding LacI/PurR family transcriptional regulator
MGDKTDNQSFKYSDLRRHFAEKIASGQLRPGQQLPSDRRIADKYGASRATVTKALKELEREGFIARRQGSGTYVQGGRDTMRVALFIAGMQQDDVFVAVERELIRQVGPDMQIVPHLPPETAEMNVDETLNRLLASAPGGAIIVPRDVDAPTQQWNQQLIDGLTREGASVVLLDRDVAPYPDVSQHDLVSLDHEQAGHDLGRHLLATGCRSLAFLHEPHDFPSIRRRLAGLRRAWQDAGLAIDEASVRNIGADEASVAQTVFQEQKPDAIVCDNDRSAALAMQELLRAGVQIPGQVKLAGFDDRPYASFLATPLTTVAQPAKSLAQACLLMLRQRIEHPDLATIRCELHGDLRIRESTSG